MKSSWADEGGIRVIELIDLIGHSNCACTQCGHFPIKIKNGECESAHQNEWIRQGMHERRGKAVSGWWWRSAPWRGSGGKEYCQKCPKRFPSRRDQQNQFCGGNPENLFLCQNFQFLLLFFFSIWIPFSSSTSTLMTSQEKCSCQAMIQFSLTYLAPHNWQSPNVQESQVYNNKPLFIKPIPNVHKLEAISKI